MRCPDSALPATCILRLMTDVCWPAARSLESPHPSRPAIGPAATPAVELETPARLSNNIISPKRSGVRPAVCIISLPSQVRHIASPAPLYHIHCHHFLIQQILRVAFASAIEPPPSNNQPPAGVVTGITIHHEPQRTVPRPETDQLARTGAEFQQLISWAASLHNVSGLLGPGCTVSAIEI
ncbi:hypothetical protein K458DRAFT_386531 [Lentithecium fluviatile CBS 122367]|uniref:Uncharacterized protein n=1 Tax=Lentithecium fluviatile CBS 122367 TaxID=1168545 RepID=A0A6G1J8M4_9PLEO|nr:hypothetical protein K458DRAFT_386531 [Lentithecium fluviatile CBS 122367]